MHSSESCTEEFFPVCPYFGLMVCFVHAIMGHCSVPELYCILTLVWSPQGALTSYCQTTYFDTYLGNYMFIACNRLQCLHLLMHTEGGLYAVCILSSSLGECYWNYSQLLSWLFCFLTLFLHVGRTHCLACSGIQPLFGLQ